MQGQSTEHCFQIFHLPQTRLGGGPGIRGPGVWKTRGLVGNAGSGVKHGDWWKTRGLSGKHGGKHGGGLNVLLF